MQYHIEGACRDTKLDKVSFMGSLYRIFGVRKRGVRVPNRTGEHPNWPIRGDSPKQGPFFRSRQPTNDFC
jgi:hypothetical protein